MRKYLIYNENDKFILTSNVIVAFSFAILFAVGFLQSKVSNSDSPIIKNILLGILIVLVIGILFLKLSVYFRRQPLRGELRGYLEIGNEYIIVAGKKYNLDEIENIEIWNYDFEGDLDFKKNDRLNFNGLLSNGIENQFKIKLLNQKVLDVRYKQDNTNQMRNSENELKNFFLLNKISLENISRVLGNSQVQMILDSGDNVPEIKSHESVSKNVPKLTSYKTEIISENKVIELEEQLKKLQKEKWKIWRLIAVGIILPFIGPYFPMRRGMLADRMGFEKSALLFAGLCIVVVPIGCYMHFQKINNQIFDVEYDMESIKRKIRQNIENESIEVEPNS